MDREAFAYAASIGYRIEYADLRAYNREGMCDTVERVIYIQYGMLPRKEKGVLWHELAHATFNDVPSLFEHVNRKQESRADEWAAHRQIDHSEYVIAEEKFGANTEWIAEELDVLHKFVIAYERTLTRLGDLIYSYSKFGAGQWAARYEVSA